MLKLFLSLLPPSGKIQKLISVCSFVDYKNLHIFNQCFDTADILILFLDVQVLYTILCIFP